MNKWHRLRGQTQVFWNGLALREKRMLVGVGLVLASLLTWLVLVQPALKKIDYWQAETPKLRAQAAALQGLLQDVSAPRPADEARCARPWTAPVCKAVTSCRRWTPAVGA